MQRQQEIAKIIIKWSFVIMIFAITACGVNKDVTEDDQLLQIENFTYNVANSMEPVVTEYVISLDNRVSITMIPFAGHFNDTGTKLGFSHTVRSYQSEPIETYFDTWLTSHSGKKELEELLINPRISESECWIGDENVKWEVECLYIIKSEIDLVTEYLWLGLSSEQEEIIIADYQKATVIVEDYLNNAKLFTQD